jgi:hypothetical protein
MKWFLAPPTLEDLIRLLRAWRFWILGAAAGALVGAALYQLAPPPFRARATVTVDFNLEQAWPQETDRQQFYYLEREVRKLEEIAWSDDVLQAVSETNGGPSLSELRDVRLHLAQPAEGGWRFYADDADPGRAGDLATAWAQAFAQHAQQDIAAASGLNALIEVALTQVADPPVRRSVPLSVYLLAGALFAWLIGSLFILLVDLEQPRPARKAPARRKSTARRKP